jgi:hypothetical protein
MASAAPQQQPPLPVPAPAAALFASLYGDASNDPTGSREGILLNPFLHHLTDNTLNTDTNEIRNRVAQSGSQHQFIALSVVHGGRARLYIAPHRWEDGLTANNPSLNNRFFAFEGELINNTGYTVELDLGIFNLLNNQQAVPTVNAITTAIAADPTLQMMGPYTAQDAHTEAVKTRKVIAIPHFIGGLFLSQPEGVTARFFWESIYPVIEGAGKQTECKALLQFFQLMITSSGVQGNPSALECARPMPPARNETLINRQVGIIHHFFPQTRPDAAMQQANAIATGIGQLAVQQQQQYEEVKREKELAKAQTVEDWLGPGRLATLLRFTGMSNESALVMALPIYQLLAKAKKADKLSVLQDGIDAELSRRGNDVLSLEISAGVFENFTSMRWHRQNENSLTTGFFGNLFLFGNTNAEQQQLLNAQVSLAQSGDQSISHADAEKILKIPITVPLDDDSYLNVERADVLASILLPPGNPFRIYIAAHHKAFVEFQPKWRSHELEPLSLSRAKGVFHIYYLSLRASEYFRAQSQSDLPVSLPDPLELMKEIRMTRTWVPNISTTFKKLIKLDELCRLGKPAPSDIDIRDDSSMISGFTSASTLTGIQSLLQQLSSTRGGGGGGGRGGGSGTPPGGAAGAAQSPQFNESLFGEIKNRKIGSKTIRSRDVRMKIESGDIPELPPSKVDKQPMCLAWHTKGMCNPNCPRAADHIEYSSAEYAPLCRWCSSHYPSASE